jgi:hypothetical protein
VRNPRAFQFSRRTGELEPERRGNSWAALGLPVLQAIPANPENTQNNLFASVSPPLRWRTGELMGEPSKRTGKRE